MLGFEMIIKSFIKFAICYVVILRIQDILDGIIVITANLSAKILAIGASGKVQDVSERVERAVNALSWWEQIVVFTDHVYLVLSSSSRTGIDSSNNLFYVFRDYTYFLQWHRFRWVHYRVKSFHQ